VKEIARYGFILALICSVAAGLLAGANELTRAKIATQAYAEEQASLKDVMPQAAKFREIKSGEEVLYYKALDNQDRVLGFVFKASGKGYSSLIQTLAGISPDGRISGIKVISLNETPGLGTRVAENKFTDKFRGKDSSSLSGVQAIAGATISSRAIMNAVTKKAQEIKELIKNEK
jgi:Na+-translocating ferredoxin:NAD+ oxidoreductase subunit G